MTLTMEPVTSLMRGVKGSSFGNNSSTLLALSEILIILYLTFKPFINYFLFYIVPIAHYSHFDHFTKVLQVRIELGCLLQEVMPTSFFSRQFWESGKGYWEINKKNRFTEIDPHSGSLGTLLLTFTADTHTHCGSPGCASHSWASQSDCPSTCFSHSSSHS